MLIKEAFWFSFMISLQQVSKNYDGSVWVLQKISFQMRKGSFYYLLGGTGAGKSTLLKMLATYEKPTEGEIKLFSYPVSKMPFRFLQQVRRSIALVPQVFEGFSQWSVWDHLRWAVRTQKKTWTRAKNAESLCYLKDFKLLEKKDWNIDSLSGGEKQRVSVICALLRKPQLLLADEPTGAQESAFTWKILNYFLKLAQTGTVVIVSTHDPEMIKRVSQKVCFLKNGRLYFQKEARWD